MDTDRLRYFCIVAKTENIHRAAEMLRLSPAALSKSIKALESEVGIKLLTPSGRGIAVTDQGRQFAQRAEQLLADFATLESSGRQISTERKSLKVGSFEVFTTHFLGPLMADYFPEENLILHELTPGKMEDAILDRHVDIGITYLPIPRAGLDFLQVTQIDMAVYARKGCFQQMPVSEIPFAIPVTPTHGTPTKVSGLDGWPEHLFQRRAKYRVTMMESALELTRNGLAAVYLPTFLATLHNRKMKDTFQIHPLKLDISLPSKYVRQPVFIVKRQSDIETDVIKRMAKGLRIICHQDK